MYKILRMQGTTCSFVVIVEIKLYLKIQRKDETPKLIPFLIASYLSKIVVFFY